MKIAVGQTLSCCQVVAPLGAGAMREVWRARGRQLPIKVLPEHFGDTVNVVLDWFEELELAERSARWGRA